MKATLNRTEHRLKQKHNADICKDCGSHKIFAVDYRYKYPGETIDEWLIYCKKCGRETEAYPTLDSAITAWNSGNGSPNYYMSEDD